MSDNILTNQIRVDYLDDNRWKSLTWIGTATGTVTMNEIYSAMATLLDEAATGDDATCITAQTPVEYTIGAIDANDADPWYITFECMQHVTGGALVTSGWTHVNASATGIVIVPVTAGGAIVVGDVGLAISHADGDTGTLLELLEPDGVTDYLVIRPTDNLDDFDTASGNLTCNAHVAVQTLTANTGEMIWANLYNVTPINQYTHVYMYQGLVSDATRARILDINNDNNTFDTDWWPEGAFDRCIQIHDYTSTTLATIDSGYITVLARKGNTLMDSFEVLTSLTSGGRNPVPISASADGNHTTGYEEITLTANPSDTYAVGDEILGGTSGARGILTAITGTTPTYVLSYVPIGDPQITFQTAAESVDAVSPATGTGTKDGIAPAAAGPALATWFTSNSSPTAVHANTTFDVADEGTSEGYGILIDCLNNPLTEVYEWTKYITRNGALTTGGTYNLSYTDAIEGEQYVGPTVYLEYTGAIGGTSMDEGDDVIQATSGATGIIVSHDTTLKQMLLRDVRGVFTTADLVTTQDVNGTVTPDTAATVFNANKASPFGSFAGGRWFLARGVVLVNWLTADENTWESIDSQGNGHTRPIAITLSVSNVVSSVLTLDTADHVSAHRLLGAGLAIDKTEFVAAATTLNTQIVNVGTTPDPDVAGKSAGGVLNIRDDSDNNHHYKIRFDSWATTIFTLSSFNASALASTAGTDETNLHYATGGFTANILRGDMVWNVTQGTESYVTKVVSDTQLEIFPAIGSQVSTDTFRINDCPVTLTTSDDVYVSLIDEFPLTGTTAEVSLVYDAPIYYRVKVSNTRAATKIVRFVTDTSITSATNNDTATIRTEDTIHV